MGVGSVLSCDGRDFAFVYLRFTSKGCVDSDASFIVFVGKGIMFDIGGFLLKFKDGMCGMKMDMGGVVGMLCVFEFIVREDVESNFKTLFDFVLCIVENVIGLGVICLDDIFVGKSGKIVEINNIDVEGCFVFVDGVVYCFDFVNVACKSRIIVDMVMFIGV